MPVRRASAGVVAGALALALVPAALAQEPDGAIDGSDRARSCALLAASPPPPPGQPPGAGPTGIPASWRQAPKHLFPNRVRLRTEAEGFNRVYEFATRRGGIYARARAGDGPWRALPLPACFAGRVASISVDDDELIALDNARRVYTMDNALKHGSRFRWTSHWGPPLWGGPGYTLPRTRAWAWSVVSPHEDRSWTDPAGNRTPIGDGKVSHIWGLRPNGRRLTFWDPWLPLDQSYEMCGPHRGRFRAVNLSAGGSYVFVIGRRGDMFTRLYDFDISGHDPVFFDYSYEDQRGAGDGAPIQLPPAGWIEQPKIRGKITSSISIHKVGLDSVHRILRVEGRRNGHPGYWQRDVAARRAAGWDFHRTDQQLRGERLPNPRHDTSARGLAEGEDRRYRMRAGGIDATLIDFNLHCSPATLRLRAGGEAHDYLLYSIDGLRQLPRRRGLDDVPRTQYGAIKWGPDRFEPVTVKATRDRIVLEERGWTFEHVPR